MNDGHPHSERHTRALTPRVKNGQSRGLGGDRDERFVTFTPSDGIELIHTFRAIVKAGVVRMSP